MRPAEAIQITRLHFEADKAIGATNEAKDEDAWTKEDDRGSPRRSEGLTIYDLSNSNPNQYVYWKDVAPRLG
jgi:hypothetical protein